MTEKERAEARAITLARIKHLEVIVYILELSLCDQEMVVSVIEQPKDAQIEAIDFSYRKIKGLKETLDVSDEIGRPF